MSTEYTEAVLGSEEVRATVEALELVLGDYEGQYWEADGHDSPEEWIIARSQYTEWVALYRKFTGRSWLGHHHQWDATGPHELTGKGG
jgi:hypothetical protein